MNNLIKATQPKLAAGKLKRMGRKGDTDLVHVNKRELAILDRLSPGHKVNPATGLREFEDEGGPAELGVDQNVTVDPDTGMVQVGGPAERGMLDRMMDYSSIGQVVGAMNRAGEATVRAGGPVEARGASRGDGYGGNEAMSGSGGGAGGDAGADAGGASTGGETAPVVNPAPPGAKTPLNSDRPRQITNGAPGGTSSTRAFIAEALSRARQNLGGGDPVQPPPVVDDPAPLGQNNGSLPPNLSGVSATGDAAMASADPTAKIRALVAGAGRRGDTDVAHLSPGMQKILQILGGSGAKNPQTGLREFAPVMAADGGGADNSGNNNNDPLLKPQPGDEGTTGPVVPPGVTGGVNTIEPWQQAGYGTPEEWTKGFGDLATEAGNINMRPGGDYSPATPYGSIAQRRDALLGTYSDPQAQFIASRYYGGAGVGNGSFNRQSLLDAIKQSDEKFYKSIGPTPNDTVLPPQPKPPVTPPPGTGGGNAGGGGGAVPPIGGGAPTNMGNLDTGQGMAWLRATRPELFSGNPQTQSSTLIASPGNLNAISASTNLVRAPVTSRRFRSRRYRSASA